jgi:hypothetical protein
VTPDDIEAMLDEAGDRLPLLTRGEAGAVVALLGQLAESADEGLRRVALDVQVRIGMRLPSP